MTIEIYSPNLKVGKNLIDAIEKKIIKLSHLAEKISRAEVFLTVDDTLPNENKVCKIRLAIFGDTLFVHKNARDFKTAVTSALKILKGLLKKKTEHRNEPPDQIISTVEV